MSEDLSTFNGNLGKIDDDVHALFAALSGKRDADASIGMDKVTGLADALTGKAAVGHSHQLSDLSDVDAAQAGEGYLLARQAGAWVPVSVNAVFGQFSVNINSVDGLADALNGKAASDHNHDAAYLGKTATAANASRLGNQLPEYYARASAATGSTASTIVDWNDAINNGVYMGSNAAHAPGSGWYIGRCYRHNDIYVTQFAWDFSADNKTFLRKKLNGTWSPWTQITGANHMVFHPDNVHANFDLAAGTYSGDVGGLTTVASGEITVTQNSRMSWSHGQGAAPLFAVAYMVCKEPDGGYSVGDIIEVTGSGRHQLNNGSGHVTGFTDTEIWWSNYESIANGTFQTIKKDGSTYSMNTLSKWKLKFVGVWA
ncbi:pyocin knob domain-containing protein [Cohaesibacter intestini]|uniref:pyocin knob domain-containing protein n=1 Tax=Cohaesibacter intestini TaxID=2211145 RepID=UPI0013008D83|nr:pyocin knob domain-containing protein [Cohaesibacter intestini]